MKNVFKVAMVAVGIFSFSTGFAQTTHKDSSLGHKIGHAATKVGHKTAQIAASGAATVADKKYDEKYGPQGQIVYINKHDHYFYVNKRGRRVYIKKSQMTDKSADKD